MLALFLAAVTFAPANDAARKVIAHDEAGATIPTRSRDDFSLSNGASISGGDCRGAGQPSRPSAERDACPRSAGPKDDACGGNNIRSGGPGGLGLVTLAHPLLAPGYNIDQLSLQFRYVVRLYNSTAAPYVPLLTSRQGRRTLI